MRGVLVGLGLTIGSLLIAWPLYRQAKASGDRFLDWQGDVTPGDRFALVPLTLVAAAVLGALIALVSAISALA